MLDAAATGTNRLDTDITLAGTQIFSVTTAGHTLALGGVIGGAAGASFNKERVGATTANAGTLRLDGSASNWVFGARHFGQTACVVSTRER